MKVAGSNPAPGTKGLSIEPGFEPGFFLAARTAIHPNVWSHDEIPKGGLRIQRFHFKKDDIQFWSVLVLVVSG
jgi:hypothetical protein